MNGPAGRILFLDDDPARAETFMAAYPGAEWVRTAEACIARLGDPAGWEEVHLDHDLGGAILVDHDRPDTGMEVVRWLCDHPRCHLRETRFIVHTHNANAACIMLFHLRATGYHALGRPFRPPSTSVRRARGAWWRRLLGTVAGFIRP